MIVHLIIIHLIKTDSDVFLFMLSTERLHFHFSLSCIGEGNGNPLQCSCLENPRDGGAWWAAIYGVGQSRTRLKQLSSSGGSSNKTPPVFIPTFLEAGLHADGVSSWED